VQNYLNVEQKKGQKPSCKFQKEHCTNKITPVVRMPRKNCLVEYNGIINSLNGNKYLQDFTGKWIIFKNPSFEVHAKIKKTKKTKQNRIKKVAFKLFGLKIELVSKRYFLINGKKVIKLHGRKIHRFKNGGTIKKETQCIHFYCWS